jgi:hypothetical protein
VVRIVAIVVALVAVPASATTAPGVGHIARTTAAGVLGAISLTVPGTPIQTPDTPVLIASCSLEFRKPPGSPDQVVTYHFSVYNQSGRTLHYVALTDRFDVANFQEAFIHDLKPDEFREVRMVRDETSAIVAVQLVRRPTFFLCGSGPDQDSNGVILPFSSLTLQTLQIDRLLIPTTNGNFVSPYETVWSRILNPGAEFVPGVPLQALAADERSTHRPGVPPRNAVPFIIESCSLRLGDKSSKNQAIVQAAIYNQSPDEFRSVAVSARSNHGTWQSSASANDLRPHEYRKVAWTTEISRGRHLRFVVCSIGPATKSDGSIVPYTSWEKT